MHLCDAYRIPLKIILIITKRKITTRESVGYEVTFKRDCKYYNIINKMSRKYISTQNIYGYDHNRVY